MYEVREGRITTDFLPKIKSDKNTTCSIMQLTRENMKFEISALGAYLRIYYSNIPSPQYCNAPIKFSYNFTIARFVPLAMHAIALFSYMHMSSK